MVASYYAAAAASDLLMAAAFLHLLLLLLLPLPALLDNTRFSSALKRLIGRAYDHRRGLAKAWNLVCQIFLISM